MAQALERKVRSAPPRRDPRETLEPLLDELMRSLGFERAVVLLYEDESAALAGRFGIGVPDTVARELIVPVTDAEDPIVSALRGGMPQRSWTASASSCPRRRRRSPHCRAASARRSRSRGRRCGAVRC